MAGSSAEPSKRRHALARRCELGCESWPNLSAFETCPACGEATTLYREMEPLGIIEAQRLKNDLEFETYYSDRCDKRGIPTDGPLPPFYAQTRGLTYDKLPGPARP